jgi:hypothetical protein
MSDTPITLILAGTLGAGAMLVLQPPLPPPVCEPVELVRFVGPQPEIHIVQEAVFGRPTVEWLTQFDEELDPQESEEHPPQRRRRHAR